MLYAEVSVYSFVSAIVFFSIGLFIIRKLRRNTIFLVKNSTTDLLILFILSICRILLPLDISCSLVISSEYVIPFIQEILSHPVWNDFSIGMILICIWIIGILISIIKEIWNLISDLNKIKKYRTIKSEQVEEVLIKDFPNKKINVVVSPEVDVPKTIGFRHASIYLPLISVSDKQMELIVMHELQHINSGDIFIKLFYLCLKAVFWWNPIVRIFQREVDHMLELKCDMLIAKNMKYEDRIIYLETILNVMKQVSLENVGTPSSISQLVNGDVHGIMKQRFEVILNKPVVNKKKVRIRSWFVIAIVFLCSYFIIIQPVYFPPAEEIAGSVSITEDNAYIVMDDDGTLEVFVDDKPYMVISYDDLYIEPFNNLLIKGGEIKEE